MGLTVAVLANLKKNAPACPGTPEDIWAELDSETTTSAIVEALQAAGHRATFLEGDLSLVERLPVVKPDICFNLCEGHWGDSRESHVPAILEMLRIPYTGSGVFSLGLTLDKPMTKRLLTYHQLPTPVFQVFHGALEPVSSLLRYPLFVKPSREGSSIGIDASSIVNSETELRRELTAQLQRFHQPILVEQFIRGREVTVGVIGNPTGHGAWPEPGAGCADPLEGYRVLPPLQVNVERYPGGDCGVYSGRIKSDPGDEYYFSCPAPLSPESSARLQSLAATVFRVTNCLDVARVDFRLDADDGEEPYVLEVNALPGLCPGYSDLALAADAVGMDYGTLINAILNAACKRYGLTQSQGE
jgi:D-alanine-D-alanine ligase